MVLKRLLSITCVCLAAVCSVGAEAGDKVVTPKDGVIHLFNGKNLDGLYVWNRGTEYEDPKNIFTVKDGMLHIRALLRRAWSTGSNDTPAKAQVSGILNM